MNIFLWLKSKQTKNYVECIPQNPHINKLVNVYSFLTYFGNHLLPNISKDYATLKQHHHLMIIAAYVSFKV